MSDVRSESNASAEVVKSRLPVELQAAKVAIICGSGLAGIADLLAKDSKVEIPYHSIPGFKSSTVAGHSGKLVVGLIGASKVPVICMSGRLHSYEGYDIKDTVFPVRVFAAFGITTLIATNAAGGLNQQYKVGDIMLLSDHINIPGLSGLHPLKGPNDEQLGPRFLALSDAYDHELRYKFYQIAKEQNISRSIHEGTYVYVSGPTYETRAECRFLLSIGGDAVGMSTAPEAIVARHQGLRVLALSLITNVAVIDKPPSALDTPVSDLSTGKANHQEVVDAANEAAEDIQKIVSLLIESI